MAAKHETKIEYAEAVPTPSPGGHVLDTSLPSDPIEHAAAVAKANTPVASTTTVPDAPAITVDDLTRALNSIRPQQTVTRNTNEGLPGGLLIVNGYYVNSNGNPINLKGELVDEPIKAPDPEDA